MSTTSELWKKRLHLPAYRLGEAALYSGISAQTVSDWEKQYNSKSAVLSQRGAKEGLSFLQLIELAVVAEMRRMGVSLRDIRSARDFLSNHWKQMHPFALLKFQSDGVDILVDHDWDSHVSLKDKLLIANRGGQYVWPFAVETRLKEFNYGTDGMVDAWKVNGIDSEIEITPKIAFGCPHVRGIATAAIRQRWIEGMNQDEISEDLDIPKGLIDEALEFEDVKKLRDRGNDWIN